MQSSLIKRIISHYRNEFRNPRQERLFISSLTFLAAFGGARAITYAIQHQIGPFHNLSVGGRHLHHLVFGIGSETLRHWVKQAEVDHGLRPGVTTADRQRIVELEKENRELRRANEILKTASAFFARELDPRLPN